MSTNIINFVITNITTTVSTNMSISTSVIDYNWFFSTVAQSFAALSAKPIPIPLDAPVTKTTLSLSFIV